MININPEMWDHLYDNPEFVFGTKPNVYFQRKLAELNPGNILLPGDGEGRNAVFAAEQGWNTFAFDLSELGREKALFLAEQKGVQLDFIASDFELIEYKNEYFDVIGLIFAHFPYEKRRIFHQRLASYLRKGGAIILQGFSRPDNLHDIRYNLEEIKEDFLGFKFIEARERKAELQEGMVLNGTIDVVEVFAIKTEV